ncbi:histidine phosphatase superfamily [Syncephalis plumigaleata]|nr:histidine phosphatase superfamily [Syncephalis plumigaleata]
MEDERQPFLAQTALLKGVLDHTRWNSARRSVILLALLLVGLIGYSLSVMMCADKDTSHLVASRLRDILGSIAPYDLPVPQSSLNEPSNTCTANNLSHPAMIPKHCQLVHFQLLARHGTRNPVVSQMQKLQTLEEELMLNKQSSSQWPQWLTDWRNPYNSSNVDQLVKQGVLDLQGLARRDICRYGQWINGKREGVGNNDNPDIRHQFASYASSEKQRCIDSASAYASIFSNRSLTLSDIHIVPRNKDPLLVPHHSCPRWEQLALNLTDLEAMKKPYIDQYSPPF